jgi:DNA polymerase-3 subunit gamma/tau
VSEPISKSKVAPVPDQPVVSEPVVVKQAPVAKPSGPIDIAGLRRFWPEVIENVKKRRRLTWSLLSASAQVISVDDKTITIGIVNAGARDSFTRSGSDEILREAFIDVTGMDRKIECVVDAEVNTPAQGRVDEDPADSNQLSGQELLMRELGAQIISKTEG